MEALATEYTFDSWATVAPVPCRKRGWPDPVAEVGIGLMASTVHFTVVEHLRHFHLLTLLFSVGFGF